MFTQCPISLSTSNSLTSWANGSPPMSLKTQNPHVPLKSVNEDEIVHFDVIQQFLARRQQELGEGAAATAAAAERLGELSKGFYRSNS